MDSFSQVMQELNEINQYTKNLTEASTDFITETPPNTMINEAVDTTIETLTTTPTTSTVNDKTEDKTEDKNYDVEHINAVIDYVIETSIAVSKTTKYKYYHSTLMRHIGHFQLIRAMVQASANKPYDNHALLLLFENFKTYYLDRRGHAMFENIGLSSRKSMILTSSEHIPLANYSFDISIIKDTTTINESIYDLENKMNILLRHLMVVLKHPLIQIGFLCTL